MQGLNETPAAGQANGGTNQSGAAQAQYSTATSEQKVTSGTPVFPLYQSQYKKSPERLISLDELAVMMMNPRVGPKDTAPIITPFQAQGKTKDHALKADFYAMALDHDDDDLERESLAELYQPWGMA